MTPFIHHDDVITIAPGPYRFGDVVAFTNPYSGKLTVHRIVHVSRKGYLTKGDNTLEPDGRVSRSSIIGRVVQVKHHGRSVKLGLGAERIVISWLSRRGWLAPLMWTIWRFIEPIARRTGDNP
jgi:hypothetical protein